jgi:hypothetical protein
MVKKYIPLIAFLITALLFTFSQAYAYTEITNCTVITEPGEYRLTQDIVDFPGFGGLTQDIVDFSDVVCINIKSNDVILDCQGHLIDGVVPNEYSYGVGIYIDGYADHTVYSNITIKNCVLGDWYAYGIYSYYTSNVRILNCSFNGNPDYGLALDFERSDNCYMDNITSYQLLHVLETFGCYLNNVYLSGEYAGITIEFSSGIVINNTRMIGTQEIVISNSDNVIVNNFYFDSPYGITLYGVEFSNFNNIVINGSNYGIYADFYTNSINFTNITINNSKSGIWLFRWSFGNTFTNISILGVEGTGVYIWRESNENYFKGLTIRNMNVGISLYNNPTSNIFEDFIISNITDNGILLRQVQDTNEFRNGRIERTGYGIRLEDAANQVFHEIIIKDSDNCGVYLWSSGYVPTQDNLFYNNIFMNRNNTCFEGIIYPNYWNTTLSRGKNILGGPFIGGNFWGRPDGKSILDELKYAIIDGIYGHPYDLLGDGTNVDYHPLARVMFVVPPIFKSLVGLGMGIAFIMEAITLLFGIDFFKTKNPFVAIVMAMIGLAVMLLMFTYLWEML